ncbi:hypothetical protein BTE56_04310 [Agrobacterium pusense]|nr:hypothetical protein BTE56_04310 [Agrobacterium pusense]SDF59871.1 hypothetical protein SAMN05421750_11753 [Agrobacterium pusense]
MVRTASRLACSSGGQLNQLIATYFSEIYCAKYNIRFSEKRYLHLKLKILLFHSSAKKQHVSKIRLRLVGSYPFKSFAVQNVCVWTKAVVSHA